LRAIEKKEEAILSIDPKRERMADLPAKPSITTGDQCQASLTRLGLLFGKGVSGGDGGWKPPGQTTNQHI